MALLLGMLAVPVQAETVTSVTQYAYDAAGRPTCATVRMNPAVFGALPADACTLGTTGSDGADRITYTAYDSADRVTQVTTGYGSGQPRVEKTATYTANGQEQTVADGKGNLTTYEYDGFDRLVKARYPTAANGLVSSTTDYNAYTYDASGNRLTWRQRDGATYTFTYDALSRARNGLRGEVYAYDNLGRRTSATYAGGAASATYDVLGRIKSETTNGLTMSYQYDLAGNRTWVTWPDNYSATYANDLTGAMTGVWENGALHLTAYAYDDLGRRTATYRQNGAQTYYGYDPASRLSSLTLDLAGAVNDQVWSFTYNATGQVKARTAANALYEWPNAQVTKTYGVNGLNQLTSVTSGTTTTPIGYGVRANLAIAGATYDPLSNLTGATGVTLAYEPTGRLWQVTAGGSATTFLYSGPDLVAEYSGGVLVRRYVPGPGTDERAAWYEGSAVTGRRYVQTDPQGSVVAQTDSAGAVVAINTYDEYGVPAAGNLGRFQYTGQAWIPELGLYHYKARAYSPTLGRFLQTDPIGYGDGLNWYAYTHNDPLNNTDPTGTDCVPGDERSSCPTCVEGKECMADDPYDPNGDANAQKWEAIKFDNLKTQLSNFFNKPCPSGSYTNAGLGVGGTAAFFGGANAGATLGVSARPDTIDPTGAQVVFSGSISPMGGVGAFVGAGVNAYNTVTGGAIRTGTSKGNYWEADAGWFVAGGASGTYDADNAQLNSVASPKGMLGAGWGAYLGVGTSYTFTLATPPLFCNGH